MVAALVRPTTAPRACRMVPAPMKLTPVTICAAMRVGSAFPPASETDSLVYSTEPMQIRMFVRRPAGLPPSSRSRPIAPPNSVARLSCRNSSRRNISTICWTKCCITLPPPLPRRPESPSGAAPGAWCGGRWRAPHHAPGAAPDGLSGRRGRGGGSVMQHFVQQMVEMFRLELFLQLSLATLFGGAIGLERELGGKPAGLRTNILICIGSVLYTKLSVSLAGGNADPTRIAAQIVTGVGFIGAGTILHARGAVVGLTSAATIWVVAAIGVALGATFYWEAAGTTLLVLVVLRGLGRVERLVARQSTRSTLSVHAHPDPTVLDELEAVVRRMGLEIERQAIRRENVDLVIDFTLLGPKRLHDEVMVALLHQPGVRTVSTGE